WIEHLSEHHHKPVPQALLSCSQEQPARQRREHNHSYKRLAYFQQTLEQFPRLVSPEEQMAAQHQREAYVLKQPVPLKRWCWMKNSYSALPMAPERTVMSGIPVNSRREGPVFQVAQSVFQAE